MEKVLVDQFICEKCSTVLSSARSCSHIKTNDAVQAVEKHDQEVKRLALITQLEKTQDMETQTIYVNEIVVGNLSQCVQLLSLICSPFVDSSQTSFRFRSFRPADGTGSG